MKKILFSFHLLFLILDTSYAQSGIQWQKCLGSGIAQSIQQTADGGFIVAALGSDTANANHGETDYWVIKMDGIGNIEWQKYFGGPHDDEAQSVQQTADGGFIVGGSTNSYWGDVTGNHSTNYDYWVIKLDSSGALQWQKCFGGYYDDKARSVQQTAD